MAIFGQENIVKASISKNCITKPCTINIEKNQWACQFEIIQIEAGKNCYNGDSLNQTGFTIKDSAGQLVFSSASKKKLSDLKLQSGIYKIYVDGGRGAYIKMKYVIKSRIP